MTKEVDNNGFWRIRENPLSKCGVFPYLGKQISGELEPNKIYKVYRPMSEISAPETIESFDGIPLIDEHEMIGEGWTDYDERPAGGVVYHTYAKDGKLFGDIRIFSEQLKDEIKNGKKELSMGYSCRYEPAQGVFDGEFYDFIQRDLRGNHVALVNRGRMGSDVRVYDQKITFDTLDGLTFEENIMEAQDKEWNEADHPRNEKGEFSEKGDYSIAHKDNEGNITKIAEVHKEDISSNNEEDYWKQQFMEVAKKKGISESEINNFVEKVEKEGAKGVMSEKEEKDYEKFAKEHNLEVMSDKEFKNFTGKSPEQFEKAYPMKKEDITWKKDGLGEKVTLKADGKKVIVRKNGDVRWYKDGKLLPELNQSLKEDDVENFILHGVRKGYSVDEEIPSKDGSPKESGVDCSLCQQGIDSMEKVDKRKGISEVEAMLYEAKKDPAKLTDELIKTILQKMEDNSYEASEKTKADDEACEEKSEDEKSCQDGCKAKDEDKVESSEKAEKSADEEAPTEEKDKAEKEETKAEDKLSALDALPEILVRLENIENSLKGRSEPDVMFGLDETPVNLNEMDKGLKKYLGE